MSRSTTQLRSGVISCLLLGCGPGQVDESSTTSSSMTTKTTTPSDMLPECAEGLSPCGGECVNLMTSYEHCGACDHECNEEDASGVCEMGRCTAVYAGCINEDDGFATCREFCTSLGEKCGAETEAEWHPCYGAVPWFEEQDCKFAQHRYSAEPGQPGAACDWIIPFNEIVEFNFVLQSVRCCCTQYGGE